MRRRRSCPALARHRKQRAPCRSRRQWPRGPCLRPVRLLRLARTRTEQSTSPPRALPTASSTSSSLPPYESLPGGGSRTPCSRAHTEAAHCRKRITGKTGLMLVGRGHAQVDRGQNREDVGLNDRNQKMQSDERNGNRHRKYRHDDAKDRGLGPSRERCRGEESHEYTVEKVARENVGPETNRERNNAGRGADNFNRKDQRGKPCNRTSKMFQVSHGPVMLDSLPVEIQEGQNRASKRHRHLPARRSEHWKNAEQIGE